MSNKEVLIQSRSFEVSFLFDGLLIGIWCCLYFAFASSDDKVTVLESEKIAWENSPEAQAIREALNPWRNHDAAEEARKDT